MEENKKKKIIVAIVGVLALLVIVSGATYAFFSATDIEEVKQITTAKEELNVKIEGPTHVSNIKPTANFIVSDTCRGIIGGVNYKNCPAPPSTSEEGNNGNKDVVRIPVNVTNKSTVDINYNLYISLEGLELNNTLISGTTEDIKWAIYKLPSEDGYSESPETFGDFYDPKREQKMINEVSIKSGEIHNYVLFIYIEESFETQNKLQNISFDVKVRGDTKPLDIVGRKLTDVILENNVVKDREPNYKLVPTSDGVSGNVTNLDKGLFRVQTEDKNKNIYYFKGDFASKVNGNYVAFGTIGEKDNFFDSSLSFEPILWQIVRINEDGSIVLLSYYESKNTFKWETDSGKPDYEGSNIQEILNEWFDNTFSEKEQSMIKETTYCNDRSDNYNAVSKRLNKENPEPTLECKDEKDRITSKVGLLTADEIVMAGGYTQDYLNSNRISIAYKYHNLFFAKTSSSFTMSSGAETDNYTFSDILYNSQTNKENNKIRPVITLKPDVKISKGLKFENTLVPSGLGTNKSPYFIGYDE